MEQITLDPPAVATGRTEVDLMSEAIQVRAEGVDWGDAAIEAALADGEWGSEAVGFRIPNREVVIPLRVQAGNGMSFTQARTILQQKVALLQREGGFLKRQPKDTPLYADIVDARLKLSGSWLQAHQDIDYEADLVLTCIPDWYGAEQSLTLKSETTLPELTDTFAGVDGDFPARCRIVVTDAQGQNQNLVMYGLRNRNYSAASSARLAYYAKDLTAMDAATITAVTGASGGNAVQHANLTGEWTPVVGTTISSGSAPMTHEGTYRVFARVKSPSGALVQTRLAWDVGDTINPTFNDPVQLMGTTEWQIADLGEVRLEKMPVGSHRWHGQVQGLGNALTLQVDRIWIMPVDEYFGLAEGSGSSGGMVGFTVRDSFDHSAGNLAGKVLPTGGGSWAGAGDADDFTIDTTNKVAQRVAVSDSNVGNGRFGIAARADIAAVEVQADVLFTASVYSGAAGSGNMHYGVLARYVDTSNWIGLVLVPDTGALALVGRFAGVNPSIVQLSSGGPSVLAVSGPLVFGGTESSPFLRATPNPWLGVANIWYRLRLVVDAAGNAQGWVGFRDYWSSVDFDKPQVSYSHSALATGGAMDDGDTGLYDAHVSATANTRRYDQFLVRSPVADPVVHANQSAELTTKGMVREDAAGAVYGAVARPQGDLPRLPVAGAEGRTTELIVKASRGDLSELADTGVDDLSVQVHYRPCHLFVPES